MLDLGLQTVRSYRNRMMKNLSVDNVPGVTQLGLTRFPPPKTPRNRKNSASR